MTEAGWLKQSLAIGRFEFRRTVRALRADKGRFALIGFGLVMMSLFLSVGAYFFATILREASTPISLPDTIYGTFSMMWFFAVFLLTQRAISQRPRIDAEALMLSSVSTRAVAGGLVVAEFVRVTTYLALPIALLTGSIAYGLRAPLLLLTLPLSVLLWELTAVIAGSVIGFGGALLVAKYRFIARHKTVLGTVAVIIGFGGYFLFQIPQGLDPALLAWLPVGWFLDLGTLGSPIESSLPRATGGFLAMAGIVVGGGALIERLTGELWFIDPVSPDEPQTDTPVTRASVSDALDAALGPVSIPANLVSQPTRRVAQMALLRTRRDPHRLVFLFLPVFFLSSFVGQVIANPSLLPSVTPPVLALLIPWLAGGLFALNPLGDEGALLPATLTAIPSGTHYVRGLATPGFVFGLPLALALPLVSAVFSPYSLAQIGALVVLSAVLTLCTIVLAPAIGMRFPRFSAITTRRSREIVPPSLTAVALYTILSVGFGGVASLSLLAPETTRTIGRLLFSAIPAGVLSLLSTQVPAANGLATWFAALGPQLSAVSLSTVQWGGYGSLLVGLSVLAFFGYRNAIRRFDRYTIA